MFLAHHRRVFYSDLHPLICLKRKLHVCCNQTQRRQRFRKTLDAYLLIVCNFVAWQHDFCAHFLTHTISRASKWLTANGQSIVLHNEFVLNQNFLHSHHLFSPDFASWFLLNCLLHSRACTIRKRLSMIMTHVDSSLHCLSEFPELQLLSTKVSSKRGSTRSH